MHKGLTHSRCAAYGYAAKFAAYPYVAGLEGVHHFAVVETVLAECL